MCNIIPRPDATCLENEPVYVGNKLLVNVKVTILPSSNNIHREKWHLVQDDHSADNSEHAAHAYFRGREFLGANIELAILRHRLIGNPNSSNMSILESPQKEWFPWL